MSCMENISPRGTNSSSTPVLQSKHPKGLDDLKTSWTWGAIHFICLQNSLLSSNVITSNTPQPPFVIKSHPLSDPPCPRPLPSCVIMTYTTWTTLHLGFWSISGPCIRRSFLLSFLDFWQIEVVQQSWWGYLHVAIRDAGAVMAIFFANTNLCFLPNIDIPPSSPLALALIMEDACVNLLPHILVLSLII